MPNPSPDKRSPTPNRSKDMMAEDQKPDWCDRCHCRDFTTDQFHPGRAGCPTSAGRIQVNAETAALARIRKAEQWRPALIAFYERDEMPEKARQLRRGAPLDYLDLRTIDALEAAFVHALVTA